MASFKTSLLFFLFFCLGGGGGGGVRFQRSSKSSEKTIFISFKKSNRIFGLAFVSKF